MDSDLKFFLKILKQSIQLFLLILLTVYAFVLIVFPTQFLQAFGFDFAIVQTSSMTPTIKRYDFVFMTEARNIKVGDIIVFYDDSHQNLIVHRVIEIESTEQGLNYYTKGDNNLYADNGYRTRQDIFAKYTFKIILLGQVITFLKTPMGITVLFLNFVTVVGIIVLWKDQKPNYTY